MVNMCTSINKLVSLNINYTQSGSMKRHRDLSKQMTLLLIRGACDNSKTWTRAERYILQYLTIFLMMYFFE